MYFSSVCNFNSIDCTNAFTENEYHIATVLKDDCSSPTVDVDIPVIHGSPMCSTGTAACLYFVKKERFY